MTQVMERITVPAAEDMNDETFCLHMTHRHKDSLAGLDALIPQFLSPYVLGMYRSFHDRLHRLRTDLAHEHLDPGR
jgi:hypothetical protein